MQSAPTAEVSAAVPVAPVHDHDGGCAERGCCGNGPCTACHGFVAGSDSMLVPPIESTLLTIGDLLPRHGAETTRLRRPPKSLG